MCERNFINEISNDRIILLATHIVSDVEAVAKEIILLKNGTVVRKDTPYHLLNEIQGHVYEVKCQNQQLKEVQQQYLVSNIKHSEQGFWVKILSKELPETYEHQQGMLNLEGVYLYHFEM